MSEGVTFEQAAAILGCHFSNVAKLLRKGELTSTGKRGASLHRQQIEALAARRAAASAAMATRSRRKYQRAAHRPDHEHEWLSPRQVAELLGVTRPAVQSRIHRPRILAACPAIGSDDLLRTTVAATLMYDTAPQAPVAIQRAPTGCPL